MSNETIFNFLFNISLVYVGTIAILNEKKLIKIEHKIIKYIKAFFKALYLSIQEKRCEKWYI